MTIARRFVTHVGLIAVVAALAVTIPAAPAQASNGLGISGDATFRVDVEDAAVDVAVAYTVSNHKPNTRNGFTITRYFFDRVFFFVPDDATDVAVTSRGANVRFTEEREDGVRFLEIVLPSRLFYQQSRTLEVTFTMDGSKLRTIEPVRVNPAHVTMWALAWGDPGRADVRIEVPEGFELDWFGSDGAVESLQRDFSVEGYDVWYAEDIADPQEWWVSTAGDRPSALTSTDLAIGGVDLEVRSWPGVDRWYDDVVDTLEEGLEPLIDAVGLEWPVDEALVITQSSVPNRYGYGGWYFTESDEIEIGEEVDELLVLHEVSHAWFNDSLFVERWISEGLADAIPAYVLRTEMGIREFPTVVVDRGSIPIPLNNWAEPTFDPDDDGARERWAYNASWWTVHQIIEEIGVENMAAVLAAAVNDEIAYRGSVDIETVDERDDWRRFLDLLEEVGGSENATDLFTERVVSSFGAERLLERTEARDAYAELAASAGGWAAPIYVRREMEDWDFGAAHEAIDDLAAFLDTRDDFRNRLAPQGWAFPETLQGEYETVAEPEDIDAMELFVAERVEAIDAYEDAKAAIDARPDFATVVGLNMVDDPAETLLAAHRALNAGDPSTTIALAEDVHDQLAAAAIVGQERIDQVVRAGWGLLSLLLLAMAWAIWRWTRRRRGLELDRLGGPSEETQPERELRPLDDHELDAMYLADSSPTGHLSAYVKAATAAEAAGVEGGGDDETLHTGLGDEPVEPSGDSGSGGSVGRETGR